MASGSTASKAIWRKRQTYLVLINGGSAFCGPKSSQAAARFTGRARLLLAQSFGKGSVRRSFRLRGDWGDALDPRRGITPPSGRSIQALGISPDNRMVQQPPRRDSS